MSRRRDPHCDRAVEAFSAALPMIDAHLAELGCPKEFHSRLLHAWAGIMTATHRPSEVTGPLWWLEHFKAYMHPMLREFGLQIPDEPVQ